MPAAHIKIRGKKYEIITLDFETYYDKEYSLRSKTLNMSEYIRSDEFLAHGVALKRGGRKTRWYYGEQINRILNSIDWTKSAMLCHNTAFDGFICSHHYNIVPAFYLDTLSMARAVHGHHLPLDLDSLARMHGLAGKVKKAALESTKGLRELPLDLLKRLGEYAIDDVDDTFELFFKMYDYMPDDELRLVDLTIRLFADPVLLVDTDRVQQELEKEVGAKTAALLKSGALSSDLMSNPKFAAQLAQAGVTPPMKISPTTGKLTFAFAKTDAGFTALADHPNPQVQALYEARRRVKSTIGETRAIRFIEAGKDGMAMPVFLHYSGAHTHRWSGGNKLNLQNLVRGGELRRSLLAPPGHVVVVSDSEQIEARVNAWLAGQDDIVQAFANKQDVYKLMASSIYGIPVDQISDMQRFLGKVCVLGLGYGMGAVKLRTTLAQGALGGPPVHLTIEECERIVNIYRSKNWKIRQLWKTMDHVITSMITGFEGQYGPLSYGRGHIKLPNGLFLHYPHLQAHPEVRRDDLVYTEASYKTRRGRTKIYGGLLTENVTQALARCIIGEQMLEVSDMYRVVTSTHDEIVTIAPEHQAEQCLDDLTRIMSKAPDWAPGLPLGAKGGYDVCYSK